MHEVFARLKACLEGDLPAALATVVSSDRPAVPLRARLLVEEGGRRTGSLGDAALDTAVAADALALLAGGRARTLDLGTVRVFVEAVQPVPRLWVYGAGHDAVPVVRYAAGAGFRVTVIDPRPALLTEERFPGAALLRRHPEEAEPPPPGAFALVMTHNFQHDKVLLALLLQRPPRYIGVLGPRVRTDRLLQQLADAGVRPDAATAARLHAPVGLDLGGETPEEIAVAIVAELVAVRHGRQGGPLRSRQGPIH